jgi:C-terminal processing protease CtpA/Prc
MYLKSIAGRVDDLDTFDRSGMWINRDTEGFKIVDITAKSPAADAGLANGDIVTAVDGKAASGLALPDIRKRLRNDKPGTVVTLAVKGKGNVKVTLRDLI